MDTVTKSKTHQDTERTRSMAWNKWRLIWVILFRLGVSGKSGTHSYWKSKDKNMEQNLMEEYEDQELTVDLTYKSS